MASIVPPVPAFLLAAAFAFAPSSALAFPQAWFVWDRDASLEPGATNRDFTGPTTIRAAVVARGLSGPVRAHQVWLTLYSREATYPDALRFDDLGCQAGRASIRPGPEPGDPHSLLLPGYRHLTGSSYEQAQNAGAYSRLGFVAAAVSDTAAMMTDPDSLYVLLELDLDLGSAVAGPASEGRCGCADQKVNIAWGRVSYLDAAGQEHLMALVWPDCIGWNDPRHDYCYSKDCFTGDPRCIANPVYASTCSAPTPATTASWGRLKATYR